VKKVFLDCGTHLCEGLNHFIANGLIDNSFEVHTFEANPACNIGERVKDLPIKVKCHNVAVWVKDGYVQFNQENHKKSGSNSPTDGASDIDGWGSSVSETGFVHAGYDTQVKVKSIDFSKFLGKFSKDDLIYCKMDIEGSEFFVLRHLIETGEIAKINTLFVEFHPINIAEESQKTIDYLVHQIKVRGVEVKMWW
jgi:FkbM family methyltransferase